MAAPLKRATPWVQVNGEWVKAADKITFREKSDRPTQWKHWMVSPTKLHNEAMNWVDQANRSENFFLYKMAEQFGANAFATLTGSYKTLCLGIKLAGQSVGSLAKLELGFFRFVTRDKSTNSYYHDLPGFADCRTTAGQVYKQFLGVYSSLFGVALVGSEYNAQVQRHYGICTKYEGEIADEHENQMQKQTKVIKSFLNNVDNCFKKEKGVDLKVDQRSWKKLYFTTSNAESKELSDTQKDHLFIAKQNEILEGNNLVWEIKNNFKKESTQCGKIHRKYIGNSFDVKKHDLLINTEIMRETIQHVPKNQRESFSYHVGRIIEESFTLECMTKDEYIDEKNPLDDNPTMMSDEEFPAIEATAKKIVNDTENKLLPHKDYLLHRNLRNVARNYASFALNVHNQLLEEIKQTTHKQNRLRVVPNRLAFLEKINSDRVIENNPKYKVISSIKKLVTSKEVTNVDSYNKQISSKLKEIDKELKTHYSFKIETPEKEKSGSEKQRTRSKSINI